MRTDTKLATIVKALAYYLYKQAGCPNGDNAIGLMTWIDEQKKILSGFEYDDEHKDDNYTEIVKIKLDDLPQWKPHIYIDYDRLKDDSEED
jgi:hypothetical protein